MDCYFLDDLQSPQKMRNCISLSQNEDMLGLLIYLFLSLRVSKEIELFGLIFSVTWKSVGQVQHIESIWLDSSKKKKLGLIKGIYFLLELI